MTSTRRLKIKSQRKTHSYRLNIYSFNNVTIKQYTSATITSTEIVTLVY